MKEKEEFDKQKSKVVKYIVYKKRTKQEVRNKFRTVIEENTLEDIISYLEEAGYLDDKEYIEKAIREFQILNHLSMKEITYKLLGKGIDRQELEEYMIEHEEELIQYEIQSAKKLYDKKKQQLEEQEIIQYLLRKGYRPENIKQGMKQE